MSHGRGIVQSSAGPAPGDRFNIDANLQVGDVDVSTTNPVPIETEDPVDIVQQPTISAAAIYAAGDALGGLLTFANAARVAGGGGTITKVVVLDEDQELAPIDVVFFNVTFTATGNNDPFDPSDADLANCIGYVDIAATDYADFTDNSVAAKASGLRMPFDYDLVGTSLFAQMVVRSAPTYTATDDITIKITVRRS